MLLKRMALPVLLQRMTPHCIAREVVAEITSSHRFSGIQEVSQDRAPALLPSQRDTMTKQRAEIGNHRLGWHPPARHSARAGQTAPSRHLNCTASDTVYPNHTYQATGTITLYVSSRIADWLRPHVAFQVLQSEQGAILSSAVHAWCVCRLAAGSACAVSCVQVCAALLSQCYGFQAP